MAQETRPVPNAASPDGSANGSGSDTPLSPNSGVRRAKAPFVESVTIRGDELVRVSAPRMNLFGGKLLRARPGVVPNTNSGAFETDTQISGGVTMEGGRELQKWDGGGAGDEDGGIDSGLTLEESTARDGQPFDQFKVYQNMTQRKADFDMNEYSTPLDRNDAFYKRHEKRASQLAAEIMSVRSLSVCLSVGCCYLV